METNEMTVKPICEVKAWDVNKDALKDVDSEN